MNAHRAKKIVEGLAALAFAGGLTGCVGAFDPETDAASPVAQRVQALVDANRSYPRWADFPRSDGAAPTPAEVASRVGGLRAGSGALADEAARIEWTLGDPAAFAAEVARRIESQPIAPATAMTQAEVEAYAAEIRRRGAAPPPIGRTPIPPPAPAPR